MSLRWPSKTEMTFQLLLLSLFGFIVYDYLAAVQSVACGASGSSGSQNCYPWGAEGPVAGDWAYASKESYIRAALAEMIILVAAILAPFSAPTRWIGMLLMIGIAAMGLWQLQRLADLL